jgi:dolichyl-phosphate-mannose--protein O-mannosyl transferase
LSPIGRRPGPGRRTVRGFVEMRPMPTDRLRSWLVAVSLALVGGAMRFFRLSWPTENGTPIFDEKHYVPQAWQMVRNGGVEDNPGYELVVHPPLGKQLVALGQWIFGYTPFGWRVTSAILGTILIVLVIRMARRLTRSTLLGAVAGVLVLADGVNFVSSRLGMLDIFVAFFVSAAFACLLVDRDDVRDRMAVVVAEGRVGESPFGPRWGVRWWRFGAGVLVGLACAVKWSGSYWLAGFGLLAVAWDVSLRRRAGVRRPWAGTWVRDVGPALWGLAVVPVLVYLATWTPWFASEMGVDRHQVGQSIGEGGTWSFVPDALRDLWYNAGKVLRFHSRLDTPMDKPHPWESKPWTWPMGLRPMLYWYDSDNLQCGQPTCASTQMLIGTPVIWWTAPGVLVWSLWRTLTRFDWRYAAILVGYGVGFLPWFLNLNRQMYYFYAVPLATFLILGLTLALGEILGKSTDGPERRATGLLVVVLFLAAAVANFAWLWPVMVGNSITISHWEAEMWLPSWL